VLTTRRVILGVLVLLLLAVAYSAWQAWRVERDLKRAEASGNQLVDAVRDKDPQAREQALSDFLLSSKSAHDGTDGAWWGGLTHLPIVGDDAEGVRSLSESLNTVGGGVESLVGVVDDLDTLSSGGRVDMDAVRSLQEPVSRSNAAFREGYRDISGLDSSGYAGPLKTRFDSYKSQLGDFSRALASADKATEVLPGFLGGDGPRNYLLVFQNNAEIRSTGGIPGSWAELHADDGKLTIVRQGTASEFPRRDTPVLPLSDGELAVYSDLLGVYFQDATFTPDFPRAARLMSARWQEKYDDQLDGVLSLDPVTLSYLLKGTGPVKVGDVTLNPSNVVEELLNRPYIEQGTEQQDKFFALAARTIFNAATRDLSSPLDFVRGLDRAAREGRFFVTSFTETEADALAGTSVTGAMPPDDDTAPHVFVGLNDATASKMSYYLRYRAEVESQSCTQGVQTLSGTMTLDQTITAAKAQQLPESVTGQAEFSTPKGAQLVAIRIYGPSGGGISDITVDGAKVDVDTVTLDNRPVVTLVALLSGPEDVLVNWSMTSGPGQTDSGVLGITPGIQPGGGQKSFDSAC
jgi:hypothetical protein